MAQKTTAATKKSTTVRNYENNPFKLALTGLNLVINKAKGVAILLIVLSIISVFSSMRPDSNTTLSDDIEQFGTVAKMMSPAQWAVAIGAIVVVALGILFISSMIGGISAYASARIAKGHEVKLSEAFHAVLERFFSFIWLQIIQGVKIFLWSLLLIVPGIIMAIRYSLANVAFFDKGLTGNAAIKESLRLTKGAWLTTFASQTLFNMATLGVISELVNTGAKSLLYRQLIQFKNGEAKPDAHILSWITLLLPFALILLAFFVIFVFVLMAAILGYANFS